MHVNILTRRAGPALPLAASMRSGMRSAGMAGTTSEPTLRESATCGVRESWAGRAVSRKYAQMGEAPPAEGGRRGPGAAHTEARNPASPQPDQ